MNKFDKGQVVVLKSGGPAMTVRNLRGRDDETELLCEWFVDGVRTDDWFPATSVKEYAPQQRTRVRPLFRG